MDSHLKLLADSSLHAEIAERDLAEGAVSAAHDRLDAADAGLAELRARWPAMSAVERRIVGGTAGALRERLDALRARTPQPAAVSDGAPEHDPEEEIDPAAA
jgi:hypothetical protein